MLDAYISELRSYYDRHQEQGGYSCIYVDIPEIASICGEIKSCVQEYHNGFPARAFFTMSQIMEKLIQTPLDIYQKTGILDQFREDRLRLYRIRKVDCGITYKREDIFHVPATARSMISTCRYSIAGYPSLYLTTSIKLGLEETAESRKKSIAARFKLVQSQQKLDITVLELGIKPQDFIQGEQRFDNESKGRYILMPSSAKQKQFEKLKGEVFYFAYVNSPWHDAEKCIYCFPDLNKQSILEEKPIFEVNRASVVPMLQLKAHALSTPREVPWKQDNAEENIGRVIRLSQCMHHHHLLRNGNHYQYYFDTDRYFKAERSRVEDWLSRVVNKRLCTACDYNKAIYNIIVAPRHSSNADFLHAVNNRVFNGAARIFYFDVQREYRGNVEAKYSDFTSFVRNIAECKTPFEIRYHYVDDCIYMGHNFTRTKSLIHTLTGRTDDKRILLFYSVILLFG